MKNITFLLLVCLLLASCVPIREKNTMEGRTTVVEGGIADAAPTALPTKNTPKPSQTPTPGYRERRPYLIKYSSYSGDGADEFYQCWGGYFPFPRFILYEDRQMIIFTSDRKYEEAILPKAELQELLTKFGNTGVYEIHATNGSPRNDETYNIPDGLEWGDGGWGEELSFDGRSITIQAELYEYVVPPVKDAIDIIQSYEYSYTGDTISYVPDGLDLYIMDPSGTFAKTELSNQIPNNEPKTWPNGFPALSWESETNIFYGNIKLDRTQTLSAFNQNLFSHVPELVVFRQDDTVFLVVACPKWDLWWD
jgi:hypothetical protein